MNEDTNTTPATSPVQTPDAYLTKQQLARRLNVSLRTVDNLVARRALPFVRLGGKLIRFPKVAVDEHIQRHLTINARGV
ncbi:MAG: DNA-binding protein [Proteobacteria bacterium]|nr:DNA-binding protein [Pseudomonadota bacterium]